MLTLNLDVLLDCFVKMLSQYLFIMCVYCCRCLINSVTIPRGVPPIQIKKVQREGTKAQDLACVTRCQEQSPHFTVR